MPSKACGSGRLGNRRRSRCATASGSRPSSTSVLTDSCAGSGGTGRSAARSRSASSASTSDAHPSSPSASSPLELTRHRLGDQRGAPAHVVAAASPPGRRATPPRLRCRATGSVSPSAGAGAHCSTTPQGSPAASDSLDDVLELFEELRRAARLGLGRSPVVTGQQQRVLGAGDRHVQQPALLVDATQRETVLVVRDLVRQLSFDR